MSFFRFSQFFSKKENDVFFTMTTMTTIHSFSLSRFYPLLFPYADVYFFVMVYYHDNPTYYHDNHDN